jgi:hypothetical protein
MVLLVLNLKFVLKKKNLIIVSNVFKLIRFINVINNILHVLKMMNLLNVGIVLDKMNNQLSVLNVKMTIF